MLLVAFAAWSTAYNLVAHWLPVAASARGVPAEQIGLLMSGGYAGAALVGAPASLLADRLGLRTVLLGVWALSAVAGLGLVLPAPLFLSLPAAMFFMATLGTLPVLSALTARWTPAGQERRGFGWLYTGGPLGLMLANGIGGLVAGYWSPAAPLWVALAGQVLATLAVVALPAPPGSQSGLAGRAVSPSGPAAGRPVLPSGPTGRPHPLSGAVSGALGAGAATGPPGAAVASHNHPSTSVPAPTSAHLPAPPARGGLALRLFLLAAAVGYGLLALPGSFTVLYASQYLHLHFMTGGLLHVGLGAAQLGWHLLLTRWPPPGVALSLGGRVTMQRGVAQALLVILAANALAGLLPVAVPAGWALAVSLVLRGSLYSLQAVAATLISQGSARGHSTPFTAAALAAGLAVAAASALGGLLYGWHPTLPLVVAGLAGAGGAVLVLLFIQQSEPGELRLTA